jgi:adenosylmethionine---8-amino-7-oxononanoate aminotransferase
VNLSFDIDHIWRPFTQMAHHHAGILPLVKIKKAKGIYLYDEKNRPIIDGNSSWWTCNIGHCHPKVVSAIQYQAERLDHVMFAGFTHEPAQNLTQRLMKLTPPTLEHVFYSDDGSTSVECALKLATQFWHNSGEPQRKSFITLSRAYHGDTVGAMSLGSTDEFHGPFDPLKFKTIQLNLPCYDLPTETHHPDEDAFLENFQKELIKNKETLAGLFLEPLILGAGGMIFYPPRLLSQIVQLAKQHDVLVIFDEVMTGFGRTGKCFSLNHIEEAPDILCLSKGITGGTLPLAATLVSKSIASAFLESGFRHQKTFFHGHSYTANPIACAASTAAIDVLMSENLISPKNELIHMKWLSYFQNSTLPLSNARFLGHIFAITVTLNPKFPEPFSYVMLKLALERGALIRPIGNMVYLMPPLCISEAELDTLFGILDECLNSYFKSFRS